MRVAILARVSKLEGQNIDRQTSELVELCKKQNWELIEVIEEKGSGYRLNTERKDIMRALELAREKKIDKVVTHEITRLGRKAVEILKFVETLIELKVSIYVQQYGQETILANGKTNTIFKNIIIPLLAGLAENELDILRERTRSGIVNARKKNGGAWGRPKGADSAAVTLARYPKVLKAIKKHPSASLRELAGIAGCAPNTVRKVKRLLSEQN